MGDPHARRLGVRAPPHTRSLGKRTMFELPGDTSAVLSLPLTADPGPHPPRHGRPARSGALPAGRPFLSKRSANGIAATASSLGRSLVRCLVHLSGAQVLDRLDFAPTPLRYTT